MTGQAVDFKVSSQDHNAIIEEELESLRSKVDELTGEVGPSLFSLVPGTNVASGLKRNKLHSEVDQQTAEINTLRSLTKVPTPMQKNSGKPGQEVNCIHQPFSIAYPYRILVAEFSWSGSKTNTEGETSGAVAG